MSYTENKNPPYAIMQTNIYTDKHYFVSTIKRIYDTCEGSMTGIETIAWVCDENGAKEKIVAQGESVSDHLRICSDLQRYGKVQEIDA